MLEHGEVIRTFLSQGHVCVIDDYEEEAVRLEHRDGKTSVFIKRKERKIMGTVKSWGRFC